ncbi:PKD domain-containing protein, partial [Corallibacter sp.]
MMKRKTLTLSLLIFSFYATILGLNNGNKSIIDTNQLPPSVDFTFNNNVCSGTAVSFNSTVTGDGPFDYDWDFGDGGTSTASNPNHVFQALGCGNRNFNVVLTVTDSNGESSMVNHTVTIKERPDIEFEDLNAGFGVDFENCNATEIAYLVEVGNVSNSSGCIASYSINWGDGNSENNISFPISHNYMTLGSFNMVITAVGNNGCQSQKAYLVRNSSNPTGGIVTPGSTVDLCTPINPLQFAISNWGENPPDTIYDIDFGDGTTFVLTQPDLESSSFYNSSNPAASDDYPIPHEYTESNCPNNSYTVLLDIITSCGTSNLTAGPITILEKPEVSFNASDSACINVNIAIDNTSSSGFNPGCNTDANWFWDMGDGTTYNVFEPVHSYSSFGTYTISLYAENYCGETTPVTQEICIEGPLSPTFLTNLNEGCGPLNVSTTNTTDESVSCLTTDYLWTVTYAADYCGTAPANWSFTGGTNQNSVNPSFNFETPGIYTLSLTATNSCGSFDTSEEIIVKAPPSASINPIENECGPSSITPVALIDTCAPSSENVTYSWSFPGGSPASSNNLDPGAINYSTNGDYVITFSITNSCGTSTVTEEFSINESPTITNTEFEQEICSGNSTTEIVLVSDSSETTYTWVAVADAGISGFDASGNTNVIGSQTLTNANSASGTVTYTVTPAIGPCVGEEVEFVVTVNPAPSFVDIPVSSSVCLNGDAPELEVSFTNATGTATYTWYSYPEADPSDITVVGSDSPTFDPPTDTVGIVFYYCVITFSGTGSCSEIETVPVSVTVVDNVAIDNSPTSETICEGGTASALSVELNGTGTGTITYQWYSNTVNSNSGGTAITGATGLTYTPPVLNTVGTYYYYVVINVDESLGCSDVLSEVYTVEV